ncbi:translation initiation factor [uncultured Rikenella sp.]|uniref:translation initiation factor n=1 Tax=uncultured Rikenella sp. TaxID=368003 RepID=UPI0025DB044F|nr:translation initiation factor [uncultured Rikenella sp.]
MSGNDWKARLGTVYSTDPDFEYTTAAAPEQETLAPARQRLRVALDRRNRGGKQVTVVADFVGSEEDLKELCRFLKQKCGVGGSAKEGEIIIQGDFRDKIVGILTDAGYKARKI